MPRVHSRPTHREGPGQAAGDEWQLPVSLEEADEVAFPWRGLIGASDVDRNRFRSFTYADPAELRGPPRVEASAEPVSDNLAKYWAAAPHHRLLLPLPVSLLHCTARAPCGKSERERAFDDHGRQTERL